MTSQREAKLRRLAESYTAAWCSQNAASVAGFYSVDGSLRVNAGPTAVGRDAIAGVAQEFMAAFPDLKVIMDDIVVDGEQTVYRWTLVGTNTGPGGTGQRVRISGFEDWRIGADGLIAESRGHFDGAEYQRQLEQGVMEPRRQPVSDGWK
jgi:predicted ester cyclase